MRSTIFAHDHQAARYPPARTNVVWVVEEDSVVRQGGGLARWKAVVWVLWRRQLLPQTA
ncbi:hypothetical protein MY4824_004191 [Beauveria thailandica]